MHNLPDYHMKRAEVARRFRNVSSMMSEVLRGRGVAQIDVRFQAMHINAISFLKVRHLVDSGQILAVYDPSLKPETARTSEKYDVVAFAFHSASTLYRKSCIVHEAVHLRTDMRGKDIIQIRDELMAWIVQAVYLRFNGLQANNYPGATNTRTLPAALAIADTLLTGNQVTHAQESALSSAIQAMPEYDGVATQVLHADGVRPRQH